RVLFRSRINKNPSYIYIKLVKEYLKITYNTDTYECMLSIITYAKKYDFNLVIKDNNNESIYLNENYHDMEHDRKYNKDLFLFDNVYSKEFILSDMHNLTELRIIKLNKRHMTDNKLDNAEPKPK